MTIIRQFGIALGAMLFLIACGGEAESASSVATLADEPTTTPADSAEPAEDAAEDETEEVDTEQQLLGFAQCMREEGIDMEDPVVDADGNVQFPTPADADFSDTDFADNVQNAATACEQYLEGVDLVAAGFDATAVEDQVLDFTGCMRANGYDMPDINMNGGGAPPDIDTSSPEWAAAFDVCGGLLAGLDDDADVGEG